jgi:hypothetical protein
MRRRFGDWHLHLCAAGSVLNVLMMMTANLVGFAVGLDGVRAMVSQLFQWSGLYFLTSVFVGLFTGVHCMYFETARRQALDGEKGR